MTGIAHSLALLLTINPRSGWLPKVLRSPRARHTGGRPPPHTIRSNTMTTLSTVPRRSDTVREMLLDLQTARLMRETTERINARGNAILAWQEGLIDRIADFHRLDASPELKRALMQPEGVL
jgi:hypothetical protein